MASIIRFLVFGLHLSVSRALNCSSPFSDILGVCLHLANVTTTYCGAQAYCSSLGGELVRGSSFLPLNGKSFPGKPEYFWVGLTDLLVERGTNRSGRRWTDGTLDPPSSDLLWVRRRPSRPPFDCSVDNSYYDKLGEGPCYFNFTPMCQPRSFPSSAARAAHFRAASIPVGLPAEEFAEGGGCSKLMTDVVSEIECSAVCVSEPKEACVAVYFNEASKECRLVLFTDATIDMGDARGWKKFVIIT